MPTLTYDETVAIRAAHLSAVTHPGLHGLKQLIEALGVPMPPDAILLDSLPAPPPALEPQLHAAAAPAPMHVYATRHSIANSGGMPTPGMAPPARRRTTRAYSTTGDAFSVPSALPPSSSPQPLLPATHAVAVTPPPGTIEPLAIDACYTAVSRLKRWFARESEGAADAEYLTDAIEAAQALPSVEPDQSFDSFRADVGAMPGDDASAASPVASPRTTHLQTEADAVARIARKFGLAPERGALVSPTAADSRRAEQSQPPDSPAFSMSESPPQSPEGLSAAGGGGGEDSVASPLLSMDGDASSPTLGRSDIMMSGTFHSSSAGDAASLRWKRASHVAGVVASMNKNNNNQAASSLPPSAAASRGITFGASVKGGSHHHTSTGLGSGSRSRALDAEIAADKRAMRAMGVSFVSSSGSVGGVGGGSMMATSQATYPPHHSVDALHRLSLNDSTDLGGTTTSHHVQARLNRIHNSNPPAIHHTKTVEWDASTNRSAGVSVSHHHAGGANSNSRATTPHRSVHGGPGGTSASQSRRESESEPSRSSGGAALLPSSTYRHGRQGQGVLNAQFLEKNDQLHRRTVDDLTKELYAKKLRQYEAKTRREQQGVVEQQTAAPARVDQSFVSTIAADTAPEHTSFDRALWTTDAVQRMGPIATHSRFYVRNGDVDIYAERTRRAATSLGDRIREAMAAVDELNRTSELDALLASGWRPLSAGSIDDTSAVPSLQNISAIPDDSLAPLKRVTKKQRRQEKAHAVALKLLETSKGRSPAGAIASYSTMQRGVERVASSPLLSSAHAGNRNIQLSRMQQASEAAHYNRLHQQL